MTYNIQSECSISAWGYLRCTNICLWHQLPAGQGRHHQLVFCQFLPETNFSCSLSDSVFLSVSFIRLLGRKWSLFSFSMHSLYWRRRRPWRDQNCKLRQWCDQIGQNFATLAKCKKVFGFFSRFYFLPKWSTYIGQSCMLLWSKFSLLNLPNIETHSVSIWSLCPSRLKKEKSYF